MLTKEQAYALGYAAQKRLLMGPGGTPEAPPAMKKRERNWFWSGAAICRDDRILIRMGGASAHTIECWNKH